MRSSASIPWRDPLEAARHERRSGSVLGLLDARLYTRQSAAVFTVVYISIGNIAAVGVVRMVEVRPSCGRPAPSYLSGRALCAAPPLRTSSVRAWSLANPP